MLRNLSGKTRQHARLANNATHTKIAPLSAFSIATPLMDSHKLNVTPFSSRRMFSGAKPFFDVTKIALAESLNDLSMINYMPYGYKLIMDMFHETTGLPWIFTILAVSMISRTVINAILFRAQIYKRNLTHFMPTLQAMGETLKKMSTYKDNNKRIHAFNKVREFRVKNKIKPFKSFFLAISIIPFLMSNFWAVMSISNTYESFTTESFLHIQNVSVSDPTMILPALIVSYNAYFFFYFFKRFSKNKSGKTNLFSEQLSQPSFKYLFTGISSVFSFYIFNTSPFLNSAVLTYFFVNNVYGQAFNKFTESDLFGKLSGSYSKKDNELYRLEHERLLKQNTNYIEQKLLEGYEELLKKKTKIDFSEDSAAEKMARQKLASLKKSAGNKN